MSHEKPQPPRYKCHKIVSAAKIVAIDFGTRLDIQPYGVVEVFPEWVKVKGAEVGGYLVQYEDGYLSYSPAKAFEEGYAKLEEIDAIADGFPDSFRTALRDLSLKPDLQSKCLYEGFSKFARKVALLEMQIAKLSQPPKPEPEGG